MARSNSKRKETVLCHHGRSCAWCSMPLTKANATVDHVLCLSAGGSSWLGNLLPACVSCNEARGDTEATEWLRRCLEVGKEVRRELVDAAIERALHHPRATKVGDVAHRLTEQRRRAYAFTLGVALEGLLEFSY